jgi:hypothetical protein
MSPNGCSTNSKRGMFINIRKCNKVKILDKIMIQNVIHEKFKSGKNMGNGCCD